MNPKLNGKGFTLIELLAVIAILAFLCVAALAIINPFGQIQKARDAQRKSDLKQIQTALELFNQDKGHYPSGTGTEVIPFGSSWGTYMTKVPQDPAGKEYKYVVDNTGGTGTGYRLYTSLDRTTDPQVCSPSCTGAPANCGGTNTCNYDVTSSNLSR